jgi:NAD(P)-dependent dehydrogenase (short-subunit alcohol dehydrogenase family)
MENRRNKFYDSRYLCLFGLGVQFQDCYRQLVLSLGREPDFLCDNAPDKWGREFFGKKCISPGELAELGDGAAIVITIRRYEDVYRQLREMGLSNISVACFDRGYDVVHSIKGLEIDQLASKEEFRGDLVQGRWTLVTGASRGVGRQIALEMAKLGSNIIAHSRSVSHVKEVIDMCLAFGVQVVPVAAELSELAEVEAMLSHLEHLVPQIDIVFNNAAVSPPCPSGFWSLSHQDYLATFSVNTIAPIRICHRLIPSMIQRGFGRVINITSSIQRRPAAMAYACSKAALDKFVHDLAPSLQNTGVMIIMVDPGWLRTDLGGARAPHAVESVIPGVLLGALLDGDVSGRWFIAQDYAGLDLPTAMQKAKFYYSQQD